MIVFISICIFYQTTIAFSVVYSYLIIVKRTRNIILKGRYLRNKILLFPLLLFAYLFVFSVSDALSMVPHINSLFVQVYVRVIRPC